MDHTHTHTPDGYNGFTNYETWALKLWIDNEEPTYKYFRDRAKELIAETDDKEGRIIALIYDLKHFLEDGCPDLGASVYADILQAGLERINFWEVAEQILEDNDD